MPSFPFDGSDGTTFVQHIHGTLQRIQPYIDSVWVDDHVIPWFAGISPDTPYLECVSTIAYFAGAYPALKFGSSVFCQSYRNPALLAKTVANIQLLTGGRFLFGIGAGWMEPEYRAYNFDFPKASVRLQQLEETLEIVKRLWAEPYVSYEGAHYKITNACCSPRPNPIPPILIGGGGEQKTLRLVAQHADWWNLPGGDLATYAHKLAVLREHCQAVGRNYDDIVKTWSAEAIVVAETEAEAARIAATSPFKNNTVFGTPSRVAEQLQAYVDLGVTYFIPRFVDFPNTAGAELFAQEVMPLLG